MTAICTPTKTRAEFESILVELGKSTIVKWCNGSLPTGEKYPNYGIVSHLIYSKSEGLSMTTYGDTASKKLLRADFIAAIKRDFAPKEKPKMNYNKMTKKDLFAELKAILVDNAEIKAKWIEQDESNNKLFGECANLKDINRELLGDTKQLEKANTEQAETIRGLETELDDLQSVYNNCSIAANEGARLVADLKEENTRIKRLAAQMLCPDVLEGK